MKILCVVNRSFVFSCCENTLQLILACEEKNIECQNVRKKGAQRLECLRAERSSVT
jgi:hypothetical protein